MSRTLRIALAAPIRPSSRSGNDVTAQRWAAHLRALGHQVTTIAVHENESVAAIGASDDFDLLVALHACRSGEAAAAWRAAYPDRPLVVALTGTDLYVDLPDSEVARRSLTIADRLIVLQSAAVDRLGRLDPAAAAKTCVIHQSVERDGLPEPAPVADEFRVVVLAHLRDIKDPLLSAAASRELGATSRVQVHHAGKALDDAWAERAKAEEAANPRYRWHGELERSAAFELLASAHVLACTSIEEGGANVVTEALAIGVPVVGTAIDGNVGLLGADHPGLIPVGDHHALAGLLGRLEADAAALAALRKHCSRLRPITDPAHERQALATLVAELAQAAPDGR